MNRCTFSARLKNQFVVVTADMSLDPHFSRSAGGLKIRASLRRLLLFSHAFEPLGLALAVCFLAACSPFSTTAAPTGDVRLPEHPRPDFQRTSWLNLNGPWRFGFDKRDAGEKRGWTKGEAGFTQSIMVPFSWGAPLSGVDNGADVGWYSRTIRIPAAWKGQRVFLVIGACDWHTTVWLDGKLLGMHRGGYTPFEFELTPDAQYDQDQCLVLRVDDTPHPFKLEGKQEYGTVRGIWQTVYLKARAPVHLDWLHFAPDIDRAMVAVKGHLSDVAPADMPFLLVFKNAGVSMPQARWWSLEDPFLYEVEAVLGGTSGEDRVSTYFGMRKISVVNLPGTAFSCIALNNKPVYLEMTLDQSYHPEGFYPMTDTRCFPSAVHVRVAGEPAGVFELPDDPADHRGILSWHAQKRDRRLREAGSYGYLVEASIPPTALAKAAEAKEIVLRLEVPDSLPGGLAIYGERFGRYQWIRPWF